VALSETESWSLGFVRDSAVDGALAWTDSTDGARWWHGFLRDPDGRLVVGDTPVGYSAGYVRNADGALVLEDDKPFASGSLRRFAAGTAFAVYE